MASLNLRNRYAGEVKLLIHTRWCPSPCLLSLLWESSIGGLSISYLLSSVCRCLVWSTSPRQFEDSPIWAGWWSSRWKKLWTLRSLSLSLRPCSNWPPCSSAAKVSLCSRLLNTRGYVLNQTQRYSVLFCSCLTVVLSRPDSRLRPSAPAPPLLVSSQDVHSSRHGNSHCLLGVAAGSSCRSRSTGM